MRCRTTLSIGLLALAGLVSGPSPAWADSPASPFSQSQLRELPGSFLERESWFSATALAALGGVVSPRDEVWTDWARREEPLGPGGRDNGYWMGHRYTVAGEILVLTGTGWATGRDDIRDTGLLLAQAQGLSAGITQILKYVVGRERPDGSNDRSFPSGHTTAAWTTAAVLHGRHGWVAGGVGYASALYVGLSRMQAGKHHPSDVLAGFAVGQWCARAVLSSTQSESSDTAWQWLVPVISDRPTLGLVRRRF